MPYSHTISNMVQQETGDFFFTTFEDIGYDHQLYLGHYRFLQARRGLFRHQHPGRIEICYLASGMQVYEVDARRYVLKGNDIYVTFPDEEHDSGGFPQEKGELFWLQVGIPREGERFLCYDCALAMPLLQRLLAIPQRCFRGSQRVQTLFEEILTAYQGQSAARAITVAAGIIRLLVEVAQCAENSPAILAPSPDINAVMARIEQQLDTTPSLDELATWMGLSTSHFKARFKREVGIPPAEYILRRKIDRARKLLQGGRPVTSVAYSLGFSSSQYFATVFKRFTGQRPRECTSHDM